MQEGQHKHTLLMTLSMSGSLKPLFLLEDKEEAAVAVEPLSRHNQRNSPSTTRAIPDR